MNLKALLEKRSAVVGRLEAFQALDAPTDEQRTAARTDTEALAKVKAEIDEAKELARAIADGSTPVELPAPPIVKRDAGGSKIEVRSTLRTPSVFTTARFGNREAAERAAVRTGMELAAGIFGNERAARWCRENGVQIRSTTAQGETINADGGYLVSPETDGEIVRLVEEYGVARRYCRIQPMTTNAYDKKKRKSGLTAAFASEGGALTASKMAFTNVKLNAKKIYTLVPYSTELDEDGIANLADEIVLESALAFATLEDDCAFNGTGASAYGGIRGIIDSVGSAGVSTQTSLTSFATCTDAFLMAALAKLPGYARNRAWFAHPEVCEAVFNRLSRAVGGVTRAEFLGGGFVTSYAGYPVIPTQVMPHAGTSATVYAVVGDLSAGVLFGDRRGMTMQNLVERYADEDLFAIKATERFDVVVHDPGTSSVAGSYVVCKLG